MLPKSPGHQQLAAFANIRYFRILHGSSHIPITLNGQNAAGVVAEKIESSSRPKVLREDVCMRTLPKILHFNRLFRQTGDPPLSIDVDHLPTSLCDLLESESPKLHTFFGSGITKA